MLVTRLLRSWSMDGVVPRFVAVLLGTLLLAVSAKVQVPFWPVPMTLQTLAVIAIGMLYGSRLGTLTVVAYLAEGALGLPVFAGGGGLAYMAGPTGGYLAGFVVAAWLAGHLAERGWTAFVPAAAVHAVCTALILLAGWAWLAGAMGAGSAFAAGVTPFLVSSAFKVLLGGGLVALLVPRR